jgi:hypothetical protein
MGKFTTPVAPFPRCKGSKITAGFDGGEIITNDCFLLLR